MLKQLFFLMLPVAAFAQNNFKSGFIVNNNGDTIKGNIVFKQWFTNPKTVGLASGTNQPIKNYSVADIKGFGVNSIAYYTRSDVHISEGRTEAGSLSQTIDSSFHADIVFLKAETIGLNISLYSYTDAVKKRYYITDSKHQKFDELGYYVYQDPVSNTIQNVYSYRRQLSAIALSLRPGDTRLLNTIQTLEYDGDAIDRVVYALNAGQVENFKLAASSAIRFFAGLGVNSNTLSFNGSAAPFPPGTSSASTNPMFTAGIDLVVNRELKKLIFRVGASVSTSNFNFSTSTPGSFKTATSLQLKSTDISIAPQIIYNFYSSAAIKVFAATGLSFNISNYGKYSYNTYYFDGTTDSQESYPIFDKSWLSIPAKIGFTLSDKVEISGAYYFAKPVISGYDFGANRSYFQAGVNYLF